MSAVKKLNMITHELSQIEPVRNMRILVVDDEAAIADGIKSLLCPNAENVVPFARRSSRQATHTVTQPSISLTTNIYDVTVVNSPKAALQAIQESLRTKKPFAMGFFDVLLNAEIDGIELVKQAFDLDPELFATFVTAYQDRSVDSIHQVLGLDRADRWDYINKPFTEGEILQKARNITTLWNLKRAKIDSDHMLAEAHRLLLQNERANTVAAIGRSVAHEFGNVLMHIVGNAELALLKNDEARMKSALETILKASETASHVLSKFKNLAQGQGTETPEYVLTNLVQTVGEALELMNHQFKKLGIEVEKTVFEQALIEAHPHSLVQVLVNVFINACYVMPQGGKLEISLEKITDFQVEIKIRDSGPGIPEDILPKVTNALFTTKGAEGSGLGLSICREIIEIEHQGQFSVSNHPRGGALVIITLPTRQDTP